MAILYNELPIDKIREFLRYEDGKLFWKHRDSGHFKSESAYKIWNKRFAGAEAGSSKVNSKLYKRVGIEGIRYGVHRVVYALHYNLPVGMDIDHINGNKIDNRIENLRKVTRSQNARNGKMKSNNTSGYTGVVWRKAIGKWRAYGKEHNKEVSLGVYSDILDAAAAAAAFRSADKGYTNRHGELA